MGRISFAAYFSCLLINLLCDRQIPDTRKITGTACAAEDTASVSQPPYKLFLKTAPSAYDQKSDRVFHSMHSYPETFPLYAAAVPLKYSYGLLSIIIPKGKIFYK